MEQLFLLWLLIGLFSEFFCLGLSCMRNYFVWKSYWCWHPSSLKQDVCCALVSKLKIDYAMWCVGCSITCVFVPFPALKWLILWMGVPLSFLNYVIQSKQLWMQPEQIYKKYLKSRMSQTLDWLPFCSERLSVWWLAWLPYFGKFFLFFWVIKVICKVTPIRLFLIGNLSPNCGVWE